MGKIVKMSFERGKKTCRKWANGLKICDSEKRFAPPGVGLSPPRGNKHVGGINVFINNPGHVIKMAAMPIYGKNPLKFFFSGTTGPISTKLGMKHLYYVALNDNTLVQFLYEGGSDQGVFQAFTYDARISKITKGLLTGYGKSTWESAHAWNFMVFCEFIALDISALIMV